MSARYFLKTPAGLISRSHQHEKKFSDFSRRRPGILPGNFPESFAQAETSFLPTPNKFPESYCSNFCDRKNKTRHWPEPEPGPAPPRESDLYGPNWSSAVKLILTFMIILVMLMIMTNY
jgi:hypothetical protein